MTEPTEETLEEVGEVEQEGKEPRARITITVYGNAPAEYEFEALGDQAVVSGWDLRQAEKNLAREFTRYKHRERREQEAT